MKKKIISFLLALALVIGVVPLNGAARAYAAEIAGDGWKLSETGVFTLLKDIELKNDESY